MREMLNKYIFLIACFYVSVAAVAQGGEEPPCPVCPPSPPGLPIDKGLLGLLALGLLFGFYKICVFTVKKKRSV
ncbi:hypothetical protein [Flavobacterium commune]|uniref:Signal peptidase n=1 Tax=Flavobacterium commune TaxID=1306519 RepID=A0A1D9P9T9_9FLAO|nr:hypothetical protein [Flavobacterium commune]AOZ99317.1 hypothetical protein BIW12_07605 [Flavobacterium commune]